MEKYHGEIHMKLNFGSFTTFKSTRCDEIL